MGTAHLLLGTQGTGDVPRATARCSGKQGIAGTALTAPLSATGRPAAAGSAVSVGGPSVGVAVGVGVPVGVAEVVGVGDEVDVVCWTKSVISVFGG